MNQQQSSRRRLAVSSQALAGCLCGLMFWLGGLSNSAFAQCTYPAGASTGCTIWPSSATPSITAAPDTSSVELGVKFRTDVTGQVTGVRFYKGTTNTGTHVGHLWTSTGTLLASVTFSGESASGWQQASFAAPVLIDANTTYVVSYYAPNGGYAADLGYFASAGMDSAPLHALADSAANGNGVFLYATGGGFPTDTYESANYWVDVVFNPTASDTTPPTVTAVSPASGSTGVSISTTVSVTFSEAIDPSTINTNTFQVLDPSSSAVAASVSYNSATRTAVLTPTLALATAATYTAVVRGGTLDPRVKDVAGNALAANYMWTFTTTATPPPPSSCPCSIWSSTVVPAVTDVGADSAVELGVKFRSDVNGFITGLRFYKAVGNTGTHIANLWSGTGTLLATATFGSESASGWQQVDFSAPVAIAANTTYVASYHTNVGHYSINSNYFASTGVDNAPLHALANGVDGSDGVFAYGTVSSFPNAGYNSTNYWVDVVFTTSASDTTPPTVTAVSPTSGASSVNVAAQVSATFSEPIDASTVTSSTFRLRDPSGNAVAASISYSAASSTATLTPTAALNPSTTYTATLVGGSTNPRIKDLAGNALVANFTWSFTTGGSPPSQGPGGPILVIASSSNPFSQYYAEILRAEGLNAFTVLDITSVTAAVLSSYDVAILGNFTLTAAQVTMFSNWVNAGGNLIAMRPDKQLATLLGLTDASTTLSNSYLLINTASGPGLGLVNQTIQYHGVADRYSLNGASSLATLYSSATTATTAPAVTLRSVGTGRAAAFTYDLARSVVYTRQGNPAWSGQERDGQMPIRSDDLFYGGTSADWIDLNKVAIPQADEQQRLLANLIVQMNQAKKPLPRFWYLPRGLKAAVVMTGDDHGNGGTAGRFDMHIADSPQGCSVDNWTCVRSTSYVEPGTPLTNAQAVSYTAQGFEVALHVDTGCSDWTPSSLDSFYTNQLAAWTSVYTGLLPPSTERTHCIVWSDYDTQPQVELSHGMRLDTNYYYWPPTWLNDRPGFFTGSGMPMRFTTRNGDLIDVYQATTQMTDESGQTYPYTINTLLDNAVGSPGYYGVFTANMHTDYNPSAGSDAIVASAQARGVPVVSALQMLRWLDGRNGSSFGSLTWSGNALSFTVAAAEGASGLQAMLPVNGPTGTLSAITLNGTSVASTISVVKGIQYAVFYAAAGNYQATYGGGGGGVPVAGVAPTSLTFASQQLGTTSAAQAVVLTNTGNAALTISGITITGTNAGDFAQTNNCGTSVNAGANCTINVTFTPTLAATRTGTLTITDNAAGSPQTVSLTGTGTGTAPATSWYAGDMHVHRSCGGSPEAVSSLYSKMSTNNLAVISLLADMGNGEVQNPTTDLPLVNGSDDPVSTTGRIVHWDAEWHWDATYFQYAHQALGGHVVALGLTQASQLWYEYTYPIFSWAHQQGGIAGFVHMQYLDGNIPTSLDCCTPIEYPVEVALGSADFIAEDVSGSDTAVDAYYKLLNTGFRPGFAAGTDYPCNGGAALGGLLTYVQVPAGQMTYSNWVNGIANGRTVVSRNGQNEFLQLTVNSTAGPGDEIQLAASGSVPVSIQWTAKQSLSGTIELVRNGVVVASWSASASSSTPANVSTTVDFPKSGWLAARRMGSNGHVLHTGAVFVTVANAPVRASAADAQYFVQWIDNLLARTSPGGDWNSYFPTSLAAAQARYSSARAMFQQIANEAAGAAVQLSPTSLTFGNQAVGTTSAAQAITLTNTGSAALTISSITIAGTNAGDFAQTNTCPVSPSTLAAAGSCTISVTFKPTATGTRTATLTVNDSATGNPHTASLTGTGGLPAVTLSPTSLAFGNQAVNTTSAAQAITLTNTGAGTLTISSITFTGANPGDYAQTNTCPVSPSTLTGGGSCVISVTFRPTATGARTATLTVNDNATGSPHTAGLTGTGQGAPAVSLSPASLSFGSQAVNTTSAAQAITLTNTGTAALTISGITVTGTNPGDYGQTNNCPASPSALAASGTCTINVTFTPTTTGTRTASLQVTDNASGSPHTAGLTGTGGSPVASLSPTSLSFASQRVGTTSSAQVVTLSNTGTAVLTIASIAIAGTNSAEFSRTTTCGATLAAGSNCTISVTFTPTGLGTRTASLQVTDNAAGSPQTVGLSGTGTSAVTVSPTSLTFTTRLIGTTSSASRVTLTNNGTAPLTITGIAIGGANSTDFARTTTCGATLAAATSCTISVTFKPTAAFARTATLSISDSDPSSPQTVSLSGTGTAVSVSPTSLSFSRQTVGTTSAAKTITVRNAGSSPLAVSGISITGTNPGDFAQTNTCGTSVAAGASCTISVTFKPTATGTRTANVSISDVDPTSPQTVRLTGSGR